MLVDDGTAKEYSGTLEDYTDFILGKNQPKLDGFKGNKKDRKAETERRDRDAALRKAAKLAEEDTARLAEECKELDRAMAEPKGAAPALMGLSMSELSRRRAVAGGKLEKAEAAWMEASEALEQGEAG